MPRGLGQGATSRPKRWERMRFIFVCSAVRAWVAAGCAARMWGGGAVIRMERAIGRELDCVCSVCLVCVCVWLLCV